MLFPRADAGNVACADMLVELKTGSTVVWSQMCCTGGAYPARGVAVRLLLPPGGLTGDTVRISRPNVTNSTVTLAEVEVVQVAPITPVNWAVYGTATQSTVTQYPASLAIDGNTDSFITNNSCALTSVNGAGYSDFWQVTLPRQRYDEIRVWHSTFQPAYPYYVTAYDGATNVGQWFANNPPLTGPFVATVPTGTAPYIDRVRVWRNSFASPLALAEVEVINWSALDAEAKPFGIGCQGTAGVPTLRALSAPINAANFDVRLDHVPAVPGLAVVASGTSYTLSGPLPLPFDLGAIGGPGCQAYVSADFTQVAIASGGVATSTLAIPNNSGLLGVPIYQQAIVLDAGANALGLTTSNALRARLGL
ncbi:MAG: hypothetical protein JNK15_20245 [Planctomycetes bacterium]|nr:hypothetical protein [Planctomycetota bacterium]